MGNLKVLVTKQGLVLVSQIEEVTSDLGEPDCKLTRPYELFKDGNEYNLRKWPDFSDQKELMIHSDSIFTIVDPTVWQVEMYAKEIKESK